MIGYSDVVERQMVKLYDSLREKDRRRYAAVEAVKLGHGGVEYIAALFECDPHTIRHGEQDIEQLPTDERPVASEKKGGRKKASVARRFAPGRGTVDRASPAGSPVHAGLRWTNRSPAALTAALQHRGFAIGVDALRRILFHELGLAPVRRSKTKRPVAFRSATRNFNTSPNCGLSMSDRIARC